jgi:hypothetical protein
MWKPEGKAEQTKKKYAPITFKIKDLHNFNTILVKITQTQKINTTDEVPHTKLEAHSKTDLTWHNSHS